MIRTPQVAILGLLALITVLATAALIGQAPASSHGDETGETVRVRAMLQADGDIEFGLRTSEGDVQPRARVFPASESRDIWLVSSPLDLVNGAEVHIIARRDGDSRVEFGVRTRDPRQDYLPAQNKFARSTAVGRWLISSPVSIPAPEAMDDDQYEQEQDDQPGPEPEDDTDSGDSDTEESSNEETEEASDVERISGGHRDGLAVVDGVLGDPDAPVLISEYGDPF